MIDQPWNGQERRTPDGSLPAQDIEAIATRASARAMEQLMELLGVDITTLAGRKRLRENLDYLDGLREGTSSVKRKAMGIGISTIVAFGLWYLIKSLAGLHLPPPVIGD